METILKIKHQDLTLADLQSKIRTSFPLDVRERIELSYLDGEGDYISIPSDEDLKLAIEESQKANPKGMASLLTILVNHKGQDSNKKMTEEMLLGLMQSGGQKPESTYQKVAPQVPNSQAKPSKPKNQPQGSIQVANTGKSQLFAGALPGPTVNIALPTQQQWNPQLPLVQYVMPPPQIYTPPVYPMPIVYPTYRPPRPPRPISWHPIIPTVRVVELCLKCRRSYGKTYWSVCSIEPGSHRCFIPCKACLSKAGIDWAVTKPYKPPHKYVVPCCR